MLRFSEAVVDRAMDEERRKLREPPNLRQANSIVNTGVSGPLTREERVALHMYTQVPLILFCCHFFFWSFLFTVP